MKVKHKEKLKLSVVTKLPIKLWIEKKLSTGENPGFSLEGEAPGRVWGAKTPQEVMNSWHMGGGK